MGDILKRIECILEKSENSNIEIFREDALRIIDLITEEVKEEKILLHGIRRSIELSWGINNKKLKETIEDVLAYYGIVNKTGISPKMITEKKGDYMIKKKFELKNAKKIHDILGNKI